MLALGGQQQGEGSSGGLVLLSRWWLALGLAAQHWQAAGVARMRGVGVWAQPVLDAFLTPPTIACVAALALASVKPAQVSQWRKGARRLMCVKMPSLPTCLSACYLLTEPHTSPHIPHPQQVLGPEGPAGPGAPACWGP